LVEANPEMSFNLNDTGLEVRFTAWHFTYRMKEDGFNERER
jgi:hypothetical protein